MPDRTQEAQPEGVHPGRGWLPALAGLLLCALAAVLWWTLALQEEANLRQRINTVAANLAAHLNADLDSRIQALQRIANRWEVRGGTPEYEFLHDADAYFRDAAGYHSIAWVDPDFFVRWQAPDNAESKNLRLSFESRRLQALEKARDDNKPVMTEPLNLVGGGKGFQIFFPLYVKGEFQGIIRAVFHAPTWVDHVLHLSYNPDSLDDFKIIIAMDEIPLLDPDGWDNLRTGGLVTTAKAEIMGHDFSFYLKPTPRYLQKNRTMLPWLVAFSGVLLAVLISLLVHFYLRSIAEARQALNAKKSLEAEIREHQETEVQLAREQQRLANIIEGTNAGTWEWNAQTGAIVINERWAGMLGYTMAELAPVSVDTWTRLIHPDDLARAEEELEKHFNGTSAYYECEVRLRHKGGDWIWILDRGKVATWSAEGKPLLMFGTQQDITARKRAEEQINHLATHDSLTGLPSLRLARDRLGLAINLARRQKNLGALMFIDLDGFKEVNDTLGHDTGDEVLKEVANRLLACARATDTVARLGGDEFLLIASGINAPANAAEIAEKILAAVSRPIEVDEHQARVGASIGIALFPDDGENPDQLVKAADTAMYQVKNTGKNNFAFAEGRR